MSADQTRPGTKPVRTYRPEPVYLSWQEYARESIEVNPLHDRRVYALFARIARARSIQELDAAVYRALRRQAAHDELRQTAFWLHLEGQRRRERRRRRPFVKPPIALADMPEQPNAPAARA
jgi:hypothetical protein